MMGANHAVTGAAAWIALTAVVPPITVGPSFSLALATGWYGQPIEVVLAGALVAAGAALLPDADHQSATIAHSVPFVGKAVTGAIANAAGGHRRGTHTALATLAVLVATVLLVLLDTFVSVLGSGGWLSTIRPGTTIAIAFLAAFALKAIRSVTFVRSWPQAWAAGALLAIGVHFLIPTVPVWFPAAVALGYAIHILGDSFTTGGVAIFYPWLPKPPAWWARTPALRVLWRTNGYGGVPLLGNTGSAREWVLGVGATAYVAVTISAAGAHLTGVNLSSLFG